MPEDERLPAADALTVLSGGAVELQGRMPWSSNATFLVTCALDGTETSAIYKPLRGERPLWDFPDGLYRREVAAYELSVALGWDLVPETVVRHDAPLGPGSLQRFVDADFSQHYFTMQDDPAHQDSFGKVAAFDVVANNADRKSGHCLVDGDGHIWAIDHGVCFHTHPKLRTVIWEFGDRPIEPSIADDLRRLSQDRLDSLSSLLEPEEVTALRRRAARLAKQGYFPSPDSDRRSYPWPLV